MSNLYANLNSALPLLQSVIQNPQAKQALGIAQTVLDIHAHDTGDESAAQLAHEAAVQVLPHVQAIAQAEFPQEAGIIGSIGALLNLLLGFFG